MANDSTIWNNRSISRCVREAVGLVKDLHQDRFSRSIFPDDCVGFPGMKIEVDSVENGYRSERLGHITGCKYRASFHSVDSS